MKLVVITDIHGNLPALKAALKAICSEGYDLLVHTGDAVAIGPYSRECVHLLHEMPNTELVMGDHDAWLTYGLPSPNPPWLTAGEAEHHFWLSTAFPPEEKERLRQWPYKLEINYAEFNIAFMHYALTSAGDEFQPLITRPTAAALDKMFEHEQADFLFYGHSHLASSIAGRANYINPGSLGCYHQPLARYVVVEFSGRTYNIEYRYAPYDDLDLVRAFEDRRVPERELIYDTFFGGRLSAGSIYQI